MTTTEQTAIERARIIAGEEYDREARDAEPFEAIWERTAAQADKLTDRRDLGLSMPLMTDEELRRWWRATIRMANALAMQKRVQTLLERAQTELKMLYLDVHEARALDDQVPLTLDPIAGRIVEGTPPAPERTPPPVPRPVLKPGRLLPPRTGDA